MTEQIPPLSNLPALCKYLFGIKIYPYQEVIIGNILNDTRKISIRATTRAGKSYAVAMGIIIYSIFNDNKRVGIIAPSSDKAKIIMNYVSDLLTSNSIFMDFVIMDAAQMTRIERLRKEVSKRKIVFNNGTSLEIRSVNLNAKGFGVMGFGYNLTIIDESAELPDNIYSKIYRMLVESKEAKILEIGNPWHLNHFYQHTLDPSWLCIKISWTDCVAQGRMTEKDILDQKQNMTELEFQVMFEAEFPLSEEDSLFKESWINIAKRKIEEPKQDYTGILGVDCARMGEDSSVLTYVRQYGGLHIVVDTIELRKTPTTEVVGKIIELCRKYRIDWINIDEGAMGGGILDTFNEYLERPDADYIVYPEVVGLVMASKSVVGGNNLNLKTDIFFNLRKLFEESRIVIPNDSLLVRQLVPFKYEVTSNGKLKIDRNQDKSPDFADSLAYACYLPSNNVTIDFLEMKR